jgi:hypothetical protein
MNWDELTPVEHTISISIPFWRIGWLFKKIKEILNKGNR